MWICTWIEDLQKTKLKQQKNPPKYKDVKFNTSQSDYHYLQLTISHGKGAVPNFIYDRDNNSSFVKSLTHDLLVSSFDGWCACLKNVFQFLCFRNKWCLKCLQWFLLGFTTWGPQKVGNKFAIQQDNFCKTELSFKGRGRGISPGYYEHGPQLISRENRRKIILNQKKPLAAWFPAYLSYYLVTWNLSDNPV